MKITRLIEARKNPASNKKVDLLTYFNSIHENCSDLPNGQKNVFISFVMFEKLGINPRPIDDNTPTGIYAYPLDLVITKLEQGFNLNKSVPYAGGYPIINLIKIKNVEKCLFLSNLQQMRAFYDKLKKAFPTEVKDLDTCIQQYNKNVYRGFQYFIYTKYGEKNCAAKLNSTLRNLGYESVFDDTNDSLIAVEPTQIVFLSSSATEHVETLQNPSSDLRHDDGVGMRIDKSYSSSSRYDYQKITTPLQYINEKTKNKFKSIDEAISGLSKLNSGAISNLEYEFGNQYRDLTVGKLLERRVIFSRKDGGFPITFDSATTQLRAYVLYMDADKKLVDAKIFPSYGTDFDHNIKLARDVIKFLYYVRSFLYSTEFKKLLTRPGIDMDSIKDDVIIFLRTHLGKDPIGREISETAIYPSFRFKEVIFGKVTTNILVKILIELEILE